MKKYIIIIIPLYILITSLAFGIPEGYNINVKVNGFKDTTIFLAYYYGDKQFIKDTIPIDNNGFGIIQGEEKLPGGIYLIVFPNMNYFEILISNDQFFSIEADTSDILNNIRFRGSEENTSFYIYQRYMNKQAKLSVDFQNRLRENIGNADSAKYLRAQINILDNDVRTAMYTIAKDNPDNFLGVFIKSMIRPEIPEFLISDTVANKDSTKWALGFKYNKEHFLDNINFSDDRLLRTPVFHKKIEDFFTKNIYQVPDSIIPQVIKVMERAKTNEEVYQYILNYLLNYFINSTIMGLDAVFVFIAEEYYLSGKAAWVSSQTLSRISDKVNKTKPNLIGNLAPDLIMETSNEEYASLHGVDARYTVLYFWEPNCGHCKVETPKLYKVFEKYKDKGLQVFAVYTQYKKVEWLNYLNEHGYDWTNVFDPNHDTNFRNLYDIFSTPVMYLLDENKEIVAKRINSETLEKMLDKMLN